MTTTTTTTTTGQLIALASVIHTGLVLIVDANARIKSLGENKKLQEVINGELVNAYFDAKDATKETKPTTKTERAEAFKERNANDGVISMINGEIESLRDLRDRLAADVEMARTVRTALSADIEKPSFHRVSTF